MLPPASVDTRLNAYYLLYNGKAIPCTPKGGPVKLTTEAGPDEPGKGQFFDRLKLAPELTFQGDDFKLLYGIETSNARCQQLGLLLRTRPYVGAPWVNEWQGKFTCNTCKFDPKNCRVTVTIATDDAYAELLSVYDQKYNLLPSDDDVPRQTVVGQIGAFLTDAKIQFLRINREALTGEGDFSGVGNDGWTLFYDNVSTISSVSGDETSQDVILFRYIKRQVLQIQLGDTWYWPDYSASGFTRVNESINAGPVGAPNPHPWTADYVKAPDIQSFRASLLTGFGSKTPLRYNGIYIYDGKGGGAVLNGTDEAAIMSGAATGTTGTYFEGDVNSANVFLSCEDITGPADYGYDPADWVKITGPDQSEFGADVGGANSSPYCTASLNVKINSSDLHCRSIYWKFGTFQFKRCFPLLDGVYNLLRLTGTPPADIANPGYIPPPRPAVQALLPPTAAELSSFYTAGTNQATGETGEDNELPRLVLAHGSDIKRFNASEPATRVLVSLKTVLDDLAALHDIGWFVNPETGYLRLEHRAFRENRQAAGQTYDLTTAPKAILPSAYSYRTAQTPRYEELIVSNAITENVASGIYYAKAALDYGESGCSNGQEGQNRLTRTAGRLTGDVPALVLSGGSLSDDCIAILAPDTFGRLPDANAKLSASLLLARYHRHGMVAPQAVVSPGNLVVNAQSLRPQRVVENQSISVCSLSVLDGITQYVTALGAGAVLSKADLTLPGGPLTLTLWLPTPTYTADPPEVTGQQFDDSFPRSFN